MSRTSKRVPFEFRLPDLGEGITEAQVLRLSMVERCYERLA